MYKYLISLLSLSFLLTGCGFHGEMRYTGGFGGFVDKRFAKRLANCERYYSPAYYYGNGMFEIRRHTITIKGWKSDFCEIEASDRALQDKNSPETFYVHKRFTDDMSEILLLAFEEPQYHEEKAIEKALTFCKKQRISECFFEKEVGRTALYHYLSPIANFFKDYQPEKETLYDELPAKNDKEKTICDGMIEDANALLRKPHNFTGIHHKKIENYVCSRIKNHTNCYTNSDRITRVYRSTEYNGKTFSKCWFDVNIDRKEVTNIYYWSANPFDLVNRTN